ncbi:cytochrome P450 [Lentinula detonsa]|uniref:Cytochrome P450 n=1 Tax=Lentinula detonsa TaxID=2804962 RepID=A0AA38PZY3_9AGAR|nr:cytochrome P450 [Lentinula detonsa]
MDSSSLHFAVPITVPTILASAILLPLSLLVSRGIYHLYFSPLSSIPGPWYAAVSDLWIIVHTLRCRKVRAIDDLFKVYGPVVRIAPTTVAFLDPDYEQQTTRMVYTALKLDKGPIYNAVQMNGHLHSVAIIEHNVHAKYKRIFSSHYSPGNIALLHPDMKVSAELLIQKIMEAKGQPVDIFHGMHLVMIDLILKSTFGHDQGALEAWSENSHDIIMSAIEDFALLILIQGIVPNWLFSVVRQFPNKRWQTFCSSGDTLFDTMADFVREQQKEKDAGRLDERDKSTLIERLFAHNDSCAPKDRLSFEDMTSESTTHLLAGVDASAVAVSYILWRFANQPLRIKQQIQAELDNAIPDAGVLPDWKTLHNLPILDALFKEGLRLHGPIPTFLERLAPRGEPLNLLGYQLPPGTVIGTQSWSMHRNARIFGNPEEFDISRWLDDTNELQDAMSQAWAPYGLGTRICIGQHLARGAMKTVLAALLRNFDVLPCPETNDKTMDMMELFGMFPVGLSCKLKFHPRT